MLENGVDVSRLTRVGSAQDEALRVERQARKRGGAVITSLITDVNGVAAKMKTHVVAIGRDTSLITSGARSRAWPCNNEGGWRFCGDINRKRRRRHGGVWETNPGRKEPFDPFALMSYSYQSDCQ